MKIAIVCDDLTQFGGAERVMLAVSDMWPDAPVYTCFASDKWASIFREKGRKLKTSFMQKIPFAEKLDRYLFPFFFHAVAYQSFDFSEYDLVFSLSSRFAHLVITKPGTKHICYMHSPGRMFWEPFEYFQRESFWGLSLLKFLSKYFLAVPLSIMRVLDFTSAQRVDHFIANSLSSKKRIKKYYKKDAEIIYPFPSFDLRSVKNSGSLEEIEKLTARKDYFFLITRLAPWKKIDVAIDSCEKLKMKLMISGDGPDFSRLKNLAGEFTTLLGHANDNEKAILYKNCRALIVTQQEDFGMVAVEALAFGKPIIAFGKGGVLEIVQPGKTGEFFYEQTSASLQSVLEKFDSAKYNPQDCMESVKKFSRELFKEKVENMVKNALEK